MIKLSLIENMIITARSSGIEKSHPDGTGKSNSQPEGKGNNFF